MSVEFEKPDALIGWFDEHWYQIKQDPESYPFPPGDFEKVFDWALSVSWRQRKVE